jgi:hypothetical protein
VAKTKVWKSDSKRTVEMMSDEAKKIKEQIEQELESFSPLYWSYNLPLQMWPSDEGGWRVLNYRPRTERVVTLDQKVTIDQLPSFCDNAAKYLRNMADLFEALRDGKIDTIYYHDETVEAAITLFESRN